MRMEILWGKKSATHGFNYQISCLERFVFLHKKLITDADKQLFIQAALRGKAV